MVPHYSGSTLDAQDRYAKGTRRILEHYFAGTPQDPQNVIVGIGKYETKACKYCSMNKRDIVELILLFKMVNAKVLKIYLRYLVKKNLHQRNVNVVSRQIYFLLRA
jgi:hypothetical protein